MIFQEQPEYRLLETDIERPNLKEIVSKFWDLHLISVYIKRHRLGIEHKLDFIQIRSNIINPFISSICILGLFVHKQLRFRTSWQIVIENNQHQTLEYVFRASNEHALTVII